MGSPANPGLTQAPPPPPNLQPKPSLPALAGSGGAQPGGGASLQSAVVEKLMFVEKTLQDAAQIMPDLAPVANDIIGQLRQKAGAVLMKSTQGGGAGSPPPGPTTPVVASPGT